MNGKLRKMMGIETLTLRLSQGELPVNECAFWENLQLLQTKFCSILQMQGQMFCVPYHIQIPSKTKPDYHRAYLRKPNKT